MAGIAHPNFVPAKYRHHVDDLQAVLECRNGGHFQMTVDPMVAAEKGMTKDETQVEKLRNQQWKSGFYV